MDIHTSFGPPPLPEGSPSFEDSAHYREAESLTRKYPEVASWMWSDSRWRFYEQKRPSDYPSREECMARIAESNAEQDRQQTQYAERRRRYRFRNMFGGR